MISIRDLLTETVTGPWDAVVARTEPISTT